VFTPSSTSFRHHRVRRTHPPPAHQSLALLVTRISAHSFPVGEYNTSEFNLQPSNGKETPTLTLTFNQATEKKPNNKPCPQPRLTRRSRWEISDWRWGGDTSDGEFGEEGGGEGGAGTTPHQPSQNDHHRGEPLLFPNVPHSTEFSVSRKPLEPHSLRGATRSFRAPSVTSHHMT